MYQFTEKTLPNLPICAFVLLLFALASKIFRSKKPFGDIPGPPSHSWLYGNMLELILYSPYGRHEFEWQKKYGPVYSIKGCIGENRLMVSDPITLRHVLADTGEFRKSPQHQFVNKNVFGDGSVLYSYGKFNIFFSPSFCSPDGFQGPKHRRIRLVMNPAFSTAALRVHIPSLEEYARQLSEKWEHSLESHSSNVLDVFQDLHKTTLRAVTECILGYDVTMDEQYEKAYENLVVAGAKRSEISILTHSILLALPTWVVNIFKLFPSPDFQKLLTHRRVSLERSEKHLQDKIEANELGIEPKEDLFDVMLHTYKKFPNKISLQEISDQFGTVSVAGEDTTANALVWGLYVLANNPEWQQRLREEVSEADDSIIERSLEFYDQFPFLNALIKEVMRFYSPLPYTERIAIRDTVVPLSRPITTRTGKQISEVPIKKGQYIEVAITSFNRLPSVWGTDAHEFKPSRWLDSNRKHGDNAIGPYSNLLTFLGGPRTCLGWRFAVLEVQIILCHLVRKFKFTAPKNSSIQSAHAISLVPIHDEGKTALPLNISLL